MAIVPVNPEGMNAFEYALLGFCQMSEAWRDRTLALHARSLATPAPSNTGLAERSRVAFVTAYNVAAAEYGG